MQPESANPRNFGRAASVPNEGCGSAQPADSIRTGRDKKRHGILNGRINYIVINRGWTVLHVSLMRKEDMT
jgi:hypothetical protein